MLEWETIKNFLKNDTWGSILRLYGYEAQQKFREARKNKDSVVKLQSSSKGKKLDIYEKDSQ
jgi:hypothetical protein